MKAEVRAAYRATVADYTAARQRGDLTAAFTALERAHVLAQRYLIAHTVTHWRMLSVGWALRDRREVLGQLLRLVATVVTMTGALVGSPAHMAPEIIEGEEAGPEADVFSLGTMLYLFATGRLPFTAANTTATLKRILDCNYEDPRQVVPTGSDELADIIAMCLVRQPNQRLANAGRLKEKLAAYLAKLGLVRIHEELPRFYSNPSGYRKSSPPASPTRCSSAASS